MANGSAVARAESLERRLERQKARAENVEGVMETGIGFAGARAATVLVPKLIPAVEPWMMPISLGAAVFAFKKALEGGDDADVALGVGLATATPAIDYGINLLATTLSKFTGK